MNKKLLIAVSALYILCLVSFPTTLVSAALVWAEYFNHLDYDIWTSQSCRLEDNEQHGVDGDHISAVIAYRDSSVAVETWKFDLREVGAWGEEFDVCKVYFMSPLELEVLDWEYYALSIVHAGGLSGISYSYRIEKYLDNQPKVLIPTYLGETHESVKGITHHFAITRHSSGLMSVYLNGSLIMSTTDNDITTTEYFGFYTWDDWAFDNVEVYDTIEIGQDIPMVLVCIAVIVLIAAIAIFVIHKQR